MYVSQSGGSGFRGLQWVSHLVIKPCERVEGSCLGRLGSGDIMTY